MKTGLFRRPGKPIRLTNGPLPYSNPYPSRDGKRIFALGTKQRGELVRYDMKSHQFEPFLSGISATDPTFSRDGKWVAYVSYPDHNLWRSRSDGSNPRGAAPYGPPLSYNVHTVSSKKSKSAIKVTFTLLPIEQWHGLSNEEKNSASISKGAGVTVVRAGREIDYGWYFMGSKRRENYDDWWRCEVSFTPDLDELFGVTHTKQKINPTESLNGILSPDMERIARDLNAEVRRRYMAVRDKERTFRSETVAEERDHLMQPLNLRAMMRSEKIKRNGSRLRYTIEEAEGDGLSFYAPSLVRDRLKLALNRDHSFFKKVYQPLLESQGMASRVELQHLQLLLLAAGRAECALKSKKEKESVQKLRNVWSNTLTAFLD